MLFALVAWGCTVLSSQGQVHVHATQGLGKVDFPVSCSRKAQIDFNHAVALLHHMTYPQARAAFEEVAAAEPGCSMAYWGIAMSLFQPLWPTRPYMSDRQAGWEAATKALAKPPPTERERMFIAAVEEFFRDPDSTDYWSRIRRWEQASEKLYSAFPDDHEVAAFYALAHLATTPANAITRTHADRAAEILLRIYRQNPSHPGAMHYLVHANDVPGRENELLEITRKYATVAPRNPHAIHMPTHIFVRLGDWNAVISGNLRAADAALEHPAGKNKEFVWDEFAHAIEYLIYAYLQKGADDRAAEQLKRLRTTDRLEPTLKTAFHIASTRARFALERDAWDEAASIVPREPSNLNWDLFTWPEAVGHFARGFGAIRLGRIDQGQTAVERLKVLEAATVKAGEDLFARNIRVLRLELGAWVANSRGETETGIEQMEAAVELEGSTPKPPVTPGPTLPANELLGDLYMERGRPSAALAAYKRSLSSYPKRFRSLLGAAKAAAATGADSEARGYYKQLVDIADGGTRTSAINEARKYLGRQPK